MQAELARRDREEANAYRQHVEKAVNESEPDFINPILNQEIQEKIGEIDNIEHEVNALIEANQQLGIAPVVMKAEDVQETMRDTNSRAVIRCRNYGSNIPGINGHMKASQETEEHCSPMNCPLAKSRATTNVNDMMQRRSDSDELDSSNENDTKGKRVTFDWVKESDWLNGNVIFLSSLFS